MTETQRSSSVDLIQSTQYKFPYHYLPTPDGFPYFGKHWGFSASYISALRLAKDWLDSLPIGAQHRHIDFGCGDGGFINALAPLLGVSAIRLEGVDYDEKAIRWAKLFAPNPDNFRVDDIANLPAETYDTGTLIEVLEHIPPAESGQFIRHMARSLKDSALLFVTVPSTEKPVERKHYRHFDFATLRECFRGDFEVVEHFGFEKRGVAQKVFTRLTMNGFIHAETRYTSQYLIHRLSTKHRALGGCGRIGMVLRKKPA